MKFDFARNAGEFCHRLFTDLRSASRYAFLQMMTFEADAAGTALAKVLQAAEIPDRRLIIDRYSRVMISDRFLYAPANLFAAALDIKVRWVNPMGPMLHRFAARNHKKMIIVDDSLFYIGGFNFSDHNFSWQDMMIRIQDRDCARCLKSDFLQTWRGQNALGRHCFPDMDLYFFDGKNNERLFRPIFKLLSGARKHITVLTPYLTHPFFQPLAMARKRGADILIIAPGGNNKPLVTENLMWQAYLHDLRLAFLPDRMSHLKAILVDDSYLLVGSCNYDYISYTVQQELIAVIKNRSLIETFRKSILHPTLDKAVVWDRRIDADNLLSASHTLSVLLRTVVGLAKMTGK